MSGNITLADNKAQAVRPSLTQTVTISGVSAATTNAVSVRTELIRIISTTDCYVQIGSAPVATSADWYLPAFVVEYFRVEPGSDKVAAIQVAAGGILYVTECN
jgi:hypothetical protein